MFPCSEAGGEVNEGAIFAGKRGRFPITHFRYAPVESRRGSARGSDVIGACGYFYYADIHTCGAGEVKAVARAASSEGVIANISLFEI